METSRPKDKSIAFLNAHFAGDEETAVACCADNFESVVFAPVELFPHLGQKKGRDWIVQSIRTQTERYSRRRFDLMTAVGDENGAALLGSVKLTKRSDARVIEFISVHFFNFEDGLIVSHHELFDSFNLVEQLIGTDLASDFAKRVAAAV